MDADSLSRAAQLGVTAFVVALTGAMAPGPFLTLTIAETVRRGRVPALLLLVGHALLEGVLLLGFAFGLQAFLRRPAVETAISVVGGGFLLWMGTSLLLGAARGTVVPRSDTPARTSRLGPIASGAAVSLSNPYWTIWWATIGVKLASDGLAIGPLGVAAFFVGHQAADVAWYGGVVMAVSSGRRLMSDRAYRFIIGGCAAFLVVLGGAFAISGLN